MPRQRSELFTLSGSASNWSTLLSGSGRTARFIGEALTAATVMNSSSSSIDTGQRAANDALILLYISCTVSTYTPVTMTVRQLEVDAKLVENTSAGPERTHTRAG